MHPNFKRADTLSRHVIGAAIEVQRTMGPGLIESIYQVVNWVTEANPGKTKEVRKYIKDHFEVDYTNEAVRKLLKKKGLKVLRPKVVPGNPPSEEEQKKTSKNILK